MRSPSHLSSPLAEAGALFGRALATPAVLALRWTASSRREPGRGIPATGHPFWRSLQAAVDEIFVAAEVLGGPPSNFHEVERLREEVDEALAFQSRRGWQADPASYHGAPPLPRTLPIVQREEQGIRFEELRFESGYAPWLGEPGRDRWLAYEENWHARVRLYRHRGGEERPWIVCIPGYRMGDPLVDHVGFRVRWLHEELGFNVAVPVMPFHGPRRRGRRGGDGYLTGDFLDTLHAQAQAIWDVRRLLRWLEDEGATRIAIYGLSLGGHTAAMVSALEPGLECVVAGIPAVDLADLVHANLPAPLAWLTRQVGFPWEEVDTLLRVVSPLEIAPAIARERCFIFAAEADGLAPPSHARDLWEHWGQPAIAWYPGGHVSFAWEDAVENLLLQAFTSTGLLSPLRRPSLRLVS